MTIRSSERPTRSTNPFVVAALALLLGATTLHGQQPAAATLPPGPAVGDLAPDFALPGATRFGLLEAPVRLSDYRGETVVLAFFFKARTKG
jgi:peroxiredoxin Q/BCP